MPPSIFKCSKSRTYHNLNTNSSLSSSRIPPTFFIKLAGVALQVFKWSTTNLIMACSSTPRRALIFDATQDFTFLSNKPKLAIALKSISVAKTCYRDFLCISMYISLVLCNRSLWTSGSGFSGSSHFSCSYLTCCSTSVALLFSGSTYSSLTNGVSYSCSFLS